MPVAPAEPSAQVQPPFQIDRSIAQRRPLRRGITRAIENLVGIPGLNDIYYDALSQPSSLNFADRVLAAMGVRYRVADEDLRRIPTGGPLIVVANHPYGGVEGVVLASLLMRARADVRLLVNYLLASIPEFRDVFLFVDPFGGADAASRNVSAIKTAFAWVRRGGCLGVFPSGEVSHLTWLRRSVSDPEWSPSIGRMARQTGAAVLPVFFDGRNGALFQLAGLVHPRLRTALLPREMLNSRRREISFSVGSVIPPSRLAGFDTDEEATAYLRVRTYILKGRCRASERGTSPVSRDDARRVRAAHRVRKVEPIAPEIEPAALAEEIARLPVDCVLHETPDFSVMLARAAQIPLCLREIGSLRELVFREVGEGTGRAVDLDRFDQSYLHLFLWNKSARHIAGAYRMGPSDEIVSRFGVAGLYTRTLFEFDRRLLDQLGPSLELGRSFVLPMYQRRHAPLALLWKGIGLHVARNPRYRRLFGPVSISDDYASMTKDLLMAFLSSHSFDSELRRLVRPTRPPRLKRFRDCDPRQLSTIVKSIDDVDELVGEIEADRRGMPVLLRQYVNLGARLLGFNIDPDFGDVLDGLVVVDLAAAQRSVLERYMGRDGAAAFLRYHQASAVSSTFAESEALPLLV